MAALEAVRRWLCLVYVWSMSACSQSRGLFRLSGTALLCWQLPHLELGAGDATPLVIQRGKGEHPAIYWLFIHPDWLSLSA